MKKTLSIVAVLALVAVLAVALVACVPSDPDKAVANLEEADYVVEKIDSKLGLALAPEGCTAIVAGTNLEDVITIYYFEDAASAKDFYAELKENYDKADEADKEGTKIGKSGKLVYAGTDAAVKAVG